MSTDNITTVGGTKASDMSKVSKRWLEKVSSSAHLYLYLRGVRLQWTFQCWSYNMGPVHFR